MNNYLILNFQNAKLFRKINKKGVNYGTKDFVFDILTQSYESRDYYPSFIEPITVHQISNMLHVLFNERPVPSLRRVLYQRNEYIFEKAQQSYLKINGGSFEEVMQTKKGVHNSWNPNPSVNWETVRRYIDDVDKYNNLVTILNETFNMNVLKMPVTRVRNLVGALDKETRLIIYNKIKSMKYIEGLIYFFGRYVDGKFAEASNDGITKRPNKNAVMVANGLEKNLNVISGQIIVPVSDEDINILRNYSKGCATILDGGLVTIDSIKNANNINVDDFRLVSEISDKKSIPAKLRKP